MKRLTRRGDAGFPNTYVKAISSSFINQGRAGYRVVPEIGTPESAKNAFPKKTACCSVEPSKEAAMSTQTQGRAGIRYILKPSR